MELDIANWLMGATSTLADTILYILLTAVTIGVIGFIWYVLSFKFKIRVRESVKGRTIIKDDRAKIVKDKRTGSIYWKLLKYKRRIPEPPSDCVDISVKGKKLVEYFRTGDDQFIPIKVNFDYQNFKESGFRPYNTNQRSLLVQEHREANDYKKKSLSDMFMTIFPFVAVIMILVVFMLFFGEVVAPMKELSSSNQAFMTKSFEVWESMEDIILEREQLQNDEILRDSAIETPPN